MSNPSKSILVAIAATLLIVVLTWSMRQVKSHKMPTTEMGSAANNEIFFLLWETSAALYVLLYEGLRGLRCSWDIQDFGHERKYTVQYWLFQSSFSKTGMYPITCVSSVRKGGGLWEGGCQLGHSLVKAVPANCNYNRKKVVRHSWIFSNHFNANPMWKSKIAWLPQILLHNNH